MSGKVPTMRKAVPLLACWAVTTVGCSETGYDLLTEHVASVDDGDGGTTGDASGGGGITVTGGSSQLPNDPTDCTSTRDTSLTAVRLQTDSGACLTQGEATFLGTEEGYEVVLAPCNETVEQRWTIEAESGGVWEIRSESSAMNLDVKFADTANGTDFVLYSPHSLYNQRYFPLPDAGGGFRLAPRHVEGKCGQVVGDETIGEKVELWPCDELNPAQIFHEIDCLDP